MSKILRFLLVFFLLSFSFSVSPSGQSTPVTFFGPEIFVRYTGKPVIEMREFSAANFCGPFILHLRNGNEDGKNRASSAEVWLNGEKIFRPSDFSQLVWGYDVQVFLDIQNILEVKIASKPGSTLKIWIEGFPISNFDYEEVTILPIGGIYNLSNGITLDVPEGAVSEALTIRLRRVEGEEVMPTLLGFDIGNMYFMAGFEAEGGPFQFNVPISVTLPAEPLVNSTCLPFPFNVNPDENAISLGMLSSQEINLMKTTGDIVTQGGITPNLVLFDCNTMTVTFQSLTEFPPDKWQQIIAEMDQVLSESDCILDPCRCCTIEVQTEESDLAIGDKCAKVTAEGRVIYKDCEDQTPEGWNIQEQSVYIEYALNPDTTEVEVCDDSQLTVRIYKYENNQKIYQPNYKFSVVSSNDDCLSVAQQDIETFVLSGNKAETATVTIDAGCNIKQELVMTVKPLIDLYPEGPMELKVGETKPIFLTVMDECGVAVENPELTWTIPPGGKISVDIEPPDYAVTGVSPGQATLSVTYKGITDSIQISVITGVPDVAEVKVLPEKECVEVNQTKTLIATVLDSGGNPIPGKSVTWSSSDESVAAVWQNGNVTGGDKGGWAWISATCEGKTGWAIVGVPTISGNYVATKSFITAAGVEVEEINNKGQVVGMDKNSGGFIYGDNNYTWINFPGAEWTDPRGINDSGQVVGNYSLGQSIFFGEYEVHITHGFIYDGSSFTTVNVPGGLYTNCHGINNSGQIVGYYGIVLLQPDDPPVEVAYGFLYDGSNFVTISNGVLCDDINDSGQIVGYGEYEHGPGFICNGQNCIAYNSAAFHGINNSGHIVGHFDKSGIGFIYENGQFKNIIVGSSTYCYCTGINDYGQIVGWYDPQSNGSMGFIITPCPFPQPFGKDVLPPYLPPRPYLPQVKSALISENK